MYISLFFLLSYIHHSPILAFSLFNYRQNDLLHFTNLIIIFKSKPHKRVCFHKFKYKNFHKKHKLTFHKFNFFYKNLSSSKNKSLSSSSAMFIIIFKEKAIVAIFAFSCKFVFSGHHFVFSHKLVIEFRGVYELVRVGFMPNPHSTKHFGGRMNPSSIVKECPIEPHEMVVRCPVHQVCGKGRRYVEI